MPHGERTEPLPPLHLFISSSNTISFFPAYPSAAFTDSPFISSVISSVFCLFSIHFYPSLPWPPSHPSNLTLLSCYRTVQQTSQNLPKVSMFDIFLQLQLQWSALYCLDNVYICVYLCVRGFTLRPQAIACLLTTMTVGLRMTPSH